jgi:predicted dehydrogenase
MARQSTEKTVSIGFTGLGGRGRGLLNDSLPLENVEIEALCNQDEETLQDAVETVVEDGRPEPTTYDRHERMVAEADLDAVVIATPWTSHLRLAMTALEHDVSVGVEVGPASSVEECWDLVRTAERSDGHCMVLENCCYGREELAVLRMVRAGLFGEVVHCECGYGHDLRERLVTGKETSAELEHGMDWRGLQHAKRNCDLYPTHGVGPIAKLLDVNSGNRFVSLSATASKARGLDDWTEENLEADHPAQDVEWRHGDVITTVLKCANGETVEVTHDVSLPRPYGRMYRVQGTDGLWQHRGQWAEDDVIHVEDRSPAHEWEDFVEYRDEWEHPLWESYLEEGTHGGHGGFDFLMLREFLDAVAEDRRPPIDVYDTATWRAIAPLSEESIENGGDAVSFPDFTNGRWLDAENHFP